MTLTDRRAQQILRPYGGWMLTDILIDPDAGISSAKSSFYGATGYVVDGARCRMQTRAKGIELGHEDPREVLPWTQVKRIAGAVPADLRERLADHRRRSRQHPADAPRCADHIHRGVYARWLAERAALNAVEGCLQDEALPLSVADAEPTDLLELLAVGAA